jgi:membrane fusion protein (multidrug efflux system)
MSKLAPYFKNKKAVVAAVGITVISLGALYKLSGNEQSPQQMAALSTKAGGGAPAGGGGQQMPPTHVEAAKARTEKMAETQSVIGNVSSYESVEIRPEIQGKIASIEFADGKAVKKGDTLFKLDSSVQAAAYAQARATLAKASNNSTRYTELQKKGFASAMKIDESQADLNLARANVQYADAMMAKTVIKAPLDGTVGIRRVSVGDFVNPGDLLVNLDQQDKMKIEFSLPEIYLRDVKVGNSVNIQTDGGQEIEGKISAIESRVSADSRSIMIQVIAENKDNILYSGQFVDVTVPISHEKDSVMVPDQAIIPVGNKVFLYKVENNIAKKTEVKVGIRTDKEAEILSGVNDGDLVVTAGHQKLMMVPMDGLPVRVSEPTAVEANPMTEEKEIGIQN